MESQDRTWYVDEENDVYIDFSTVNSIFTSHPPYQINIVLNSGAIVYLDMDDWSRKIIACFHSYLRYNKRIGNVHGRRR